MNSAGDKVSFAFPDCWEDDARMSALFAPFRPKNLNPDDWSSKMKFWVLLIENWCERNRSPSVSLETLKKEFSRKGSEPACLEVVFDTLSSSGVLLTRENFLMSDTSWKEWALRMSVTKFLNRTVDILKFSFLGKISQRPTVYVHLPVLKQLGLNLLKQMPLSYYGKLVRFDELMKLLEKYNSDDLNLILLWLQKNGYVAILKETNRVLVKFPKNDAVPVKITETDIGIFKLEMQQNILEKHINKLENEKIMAMEKTKYYLASNMKSLAKMTLRRKREIEKAIENNSAVAENIRGILYRIDQIALDSDIIETYKTGIASLEKLYKETGLNQLSVSSTMEELECALNLGKDIGESMILPSDNSIDQSLEDELNELLIGDLPNVPDEIVCPDHAETEKPKKKSDVGEELIQQIEALTT